MKLYTYFRSSAAYRVRIALNLKGLAYQAIPVHLLRTGGEHRQEDYLAINPAALVPALVDGERALSQSMAIIEYLDETHPEPSLLPGAATDRARIRGIAQAIACDIHPLNNLRVLQYLGRELGATKEQKDAWYRHWVELGLEALETTLAGDARTGAFCHGDTPTLADCCLVPQVFNARRLNCRIDKLAVINRIVERCEAMESFRLAAPENQPDAE
ncbi:MAG: maleylacetoacetate isomerase [Azoarcus sp.]|nr:maleylacetoacetate isomerase [Azoarcus sp.]